MLMGVCIYSATKKKKHYILSMSIFCVYKNTFEVPKKNQIFSFLNLYYAYILSVIWISNSKFTNSNNC